MPAPAPPGGGMASMFGPDMFAKLAANPKTAAMLNNPQTLVLLKNVGQNEDIDYVLKIFPPYFYITQAKIRMLQSNPNAMSQMI